MLPAVAEVVAVGELRAGRLEQPRQRDAGLLQALLGLLGVFGEALAADGELVEVVVMRPISFVLFVGRHCYALVWPGLLRSRHAAAWCRNVRQTLDDVPANFITPPDDNELHLV